MAVDLSSNEDLQQLFLLELLVDCIKFDYKKIDLDKSTVDLLKQTCVRFNFLNFPIIEVCEEDFCPTQGNYKASDIIFKNGKSCFFSLSGLPPNTACLKIGATIIRQKDEPPPLVIGTTCIQLDRSFVNVLNNYRQSGETVEVTKSLKDVFPIVDDKGIVIGTITLFVRLSSFGKAIITHFKIPQENETGYLFRSNNEPDQSKTVTGPNSSPIIKTTPTKSVPPGPSTTPKRRTSGAPSQKSGGTGTKTGKKNTSEKGLGNVEKKKAGNTPANVQGQAGSSLTFLGEEPGLFSGTKGGTYLGVAPSTAPSSAPVKVPGSTAGEKPSTAPGAPLEIKPETVSGGWSGDRIGLVHGDTPGMRTGMVHGGAKAAHKHFPGEKQGMAIHAGAPRGEHRMFPGAAPEQVPGIHPGVFPETTGVFSGGDAGIIPTPGTLGHSYGQIPGFIPGFTPEMGMGERAGMISYANPQSLLALRCNIDNVINRHYKELAVSINGHEFTINILRKTRKKKEKASKLKLCGRIPGKEQTDSDESTVEESSNTIEQQKLTTVEDKKETPTMNDMNRQEEAVDIKTKPSKIPETKDSNTTQQPLGTPFKLCECDIPLPKGFRLPNSVLSKYQSQNETNAQLTEPTNVPTALPPETPSNTKVGTPITKIVTPATSIASSSPLKKIRKAKKQKIPKENPKTFCLQPDCPMGFTLPPNVPLQNKIIKVPCCSQLPMHPGSIGLKGSQIILQLANGQYSDLYSNKTCHGQKKSPYALQLGAANQATNKCTKMMLELPTPKLKIEKVLTNVNNTQYVESDFLIPEHTKRKFDESKRQKNTGKKKRRKEKI